MKKILILLHLFVPFVCIAQITVADYSYRENLSSSQLASSYKATGFIRQFDYTKDLETRINKEVEKKIKAEVDKRLSEISFTPAKKTTAKKGE